MVDAVVVTGNEVPRRAARRAQLERDRTREFAAVAGERVRQRAPRETRDVLQPVRRHRLPADGLGDVAGVDPTLGDPRRDERLDRELPGHPVDAPVRVTRSQGGAQIGRAGPPPLERALAFGRPRSRSTIAAAPSSTLPAALEPTREHRQPVGEPALRARDGEVVGLGEVQDDVGHRPAVADASGSTSRRRRAAQQGVELGVLLCRVR